MPRKFKTPASVAQNRENQRRSRARQRDLMDEMRKRIQEYERRDAMASVELQRAARAATRENQLLRAMLAHRGVLPDEIHAFLHPSDDELEGIISNRAEQRTGGHTCPSASDASPDAPVLRLPGAPAVTMQPPADPEYEQAGNGTQAAALFTPQSIGESERSKPDGQQSELLMSPALAETSQTPPLKTPCAAAADIIAGLSGDGDAAAALLKLGCSNPGNCFVKNEKLFQIIDNIL